MLVNFSFSDANICMLHQYGLLTNAYKHIIDRTLLIPEKILFVSCISFENFCESQVMIMVDGLVRCLIDMGESMLLTLLASICQSLFSMTKISLETLKG